MNNSSSEKRRGAGNTGGSSTHVLRTTAPGQANNSSASGNNSHNSNSRSNIIAPPPRAQLGGTPSSSSSPSPEERNVHAHGANNGSSTPSSRRDSNAPSTGAQASVAAAAAATQLVKEKDLRIAALERELGVMETEFQRELDKLSQNESETASFWQAKHSALNQQFLRTDTELRLMRAELDVREAEREELRAGWETMKREVRERDDEIRDLKAQVRGLKEWVSTSTKADSSTSDEVFGDGMARLGNGLQNWVIVNFRRAKLGMFLAMNPGRLAISRNVDLHAHDLDILRTNDGAVLQELGQLVPTYEELAQTAKVHLLQSVVSRILVNSIFDAYFVGLSRDEAEQFAQMESLLASIGMCRVLHSHGGWGLNAHRRYQERQKQSTSGGLRHSQYCERKRHRRCRCRHRRLLRRSSYESTGYSTP